ncbi:MAG: helix-turn-helix transcriptional regulator [Nocardioidaceae bacterium]
MEEPTRFEPLWSVEDTARYLAVPMSTLYNWRCQRNGPPGYRIGRYLRYRPAEVKSWVDGRALAS